MEIYQEKSDSPIPELDMVNYIYPNLLKIVIVDIMLFMIYL